MKVQNKVLVDYLNEINLNNTVNEVVLNFEEEGVTTIAMSPDNVLFVKNKILKDAFIQYQVIGKITFDELSTFIKFLQLFGDSLEIKKSSNSLLISDDNNKTGEFILVNEEYINKEQKEPNVVYDIEFDIDIDIFKDINKCADLVSDNFKLIKLEIKNKNLTVTTGDIHTIVKKIPINKEVKNCKVVVGNMLGKITEILQGTITMKLKNEYPITINKKTDKGNLVYIIAPMDPGEEQKKEVEVEDQI